MFYNHISSKALYVLRDVVVQNFSYFIICIKLMSWLFTYLGFGRILAKQSGLMCCELASLHNHITMIS